jgi:transposase InsO family protein
MSDYFKERAEKQMTGTPEGVPVLAPLAPAGLAHPARESSPPPAEPEAEGQADRPDEPALVEPFGEPVGPPRLRPTKKGQRLVKKSTSPKLKISPEQRLLILDTWRRSGLPAADFSTIVGIPTHTLYSWKKRFEQEGPAGLMDRPRGGRKGSKLPDLTKRTILMLKESNPDWGCQRISDMLVRGPALPASPTAVARVLKEAGYELEEVSTRRHPDQVHRFERARSNQLWQTDLFTFVLKRQNRRVYLVAFMDDHSRFLTGFGLHASQSSALVLEVLRTAITSYGPPEEILTDNGTQYVTWRGKSAFTKELEKRGIRQVVASPRRPQTLGKIERFWGTLWRECVETAVFLDLADAQRRIGHFIDYYNFQRTHQGIDGLVPADRYFGAGSEVLATLKKRVAANALELARQGVPKKPFYLTGQVGDKSFSVHAEGERVILKRQGEERQEVELVPPEDKTSSGPASQQTLPEPICPNGSPVTPLSEPLMPSAEEPGSSPLDQILPQLDEAFPSGSDRYEKGAGI